MSYRCENDKAERSSFEGKTVRLLVLQSSSLVEKAELSLAKEKEELLVKARQLEQKIFRCEADVEEELKRFKKDNRLVGYSDVWEIAFVC